MPPVRGADVDAVNMSDSRRITLRHMKSVALDIGSLQDPVAGAEIVATAAAIMEAPSVRFMYIDDLVRKKHIEARVDVMLLVVEFKKICKLLATDPSGGATKHSAEWIRELVYETLTELRSLKISIEIGRTNEAFESWDSLAAKTQASENSVETKGLKVIGEGAGMSWGSRKVSAHEAVVAKVNSKIHSTPVEKVAPQTGTTASRTPGAMCSFCNKPNHTDVQCTKRIDALKRENLQRAATTKRSRSRSRDRRRRERSPSRRRRSRSRSPQERKEPRRDERGPPNRPPLKEPKKERD